MLSILPADREVSEYLVVPTDADVEAAVAGIVPVAWMNNGQACVAQTRILHARQVRTGTYSVNTFSLDMLGPFGGYKNSGLGREFGPEGYDAHLEHKMIHLPAGWEA